MFRDDCELFDMTHSHVTLLQSPKAIFVSGHWATVKLCKSYQKTLNHMLWYTLHSEVYRNNTIIKPLKNIVTFRWKAQSCLFCPFRLVILTLCFTAVFLSSNPLCSLVSQDYLELLFSVHTNERSIYGKIDHFLGPLVLRAKLLPVQLHCARFFFSAVSIEVEVHDIIWQLLYYFFFHSNKIFVEIKNGSF